MRGGGGGAGVAGASLNTRRSERSRIGEMTWWRSRGSRSQSKHKEEVRGAEEQDW